MLPPVSGPAVPVKTPTLAEGANQGAQNGARSALANAAAEGGPARLKPETLRAVDPSRQSEPGARVTRDGSGLTDTRPAGPPPAFVETLLERQARVAFDPPDTPNAPDTPDAPEASLEEDTPTVTREAQAEAGFAETRALATEPEPPKIDRKE